MTERATEYQIAPSFLNRWSTRAYNGAKISESELLTCLEAARWAPSAYNMQPWSFVYSVNGSKDWNGFVDLLNDSNAIWVKRASALVFIIAERVDSQEKVSRTYEIDIGICTAHLMMQAHLLGWFTHPMVGIKTQEISTRFQLCERYIPLLAVSIGKQGSKEHLPEPLQGRETPSQRKPLKSMVFEGFEEASVFFKNNR